MKKIATVILFSTILGVLIVPSVLAERYYCGYAYFGSPGGSPLPNGSTSAIYTINPDVPDEEYYFAWTGPIMSYASGYWLQAGYQKGETTDYAKRYYIEKHSVSGNKLYISSSGPSTGRTKGYTVELSTGSSSWSCAAGSYTKTITMNPTSPIDYQSVVETSTTDIEIDDTHFTHIYAKYQSDWYEWDEDDVAYFEDDPYELDPISITEFEGSGGG